MNMHIHQLALIAQQGSDSKPSVVWIPSEKIIVHCLPLPTAPKRKWQELAPWLLEDRLLQPVDNMHFVIIDQKSNENLEVIAVSKQTLSAWLQELNDSQISDVSLIPDYLALPWSDSSISIIQRDDFLLVRTGPFSGFAANPNIAWALIETLISESSNQENLSIFKSSDISLDLIPEALRSRVESQSIEVDWRLAKPLLSANLLVGEFQQKKTATGSRKWWAIAALLLISASFYFTYFKSNENEAKSSLEARQQNAQTQSSLTSNQAKVSASNGSPLRANSQPPERQVQQRKPRVNAELLGIVINPDFSSATIKVNGQAEKVFHIGDELDRGQELTSISPNEIVVEENGQAVHIPLKKADALLKQQETKDDVSRGNEQSGFAMANMFAAVPVQVDNFDTGLKLNSLSEEMKMLADIQDGDIVVQVDNKSIQELMSDPSIWASYTTQTELAVTVIRDGQELILYVNAFSLSAQILPNIASELIR